MVLTTLPRSQSRHLSPSLYCPATSLPNEVSKRQIFSTSKGTTFGSIDHNRSQLQPIKFLVHQNSSVIDFSNTWPCWRWESNAEMWGSRFSLSKVVERQQASDEVYTLLATRKLPRHRVSTITYVTLYPWKKYSPHEIEVTTTFLGWSTS